MAVTEEQRKENMKSTTLSMSVAIGIICMYIFGHAGSLMYENGLGAGSAFMMMVEDLKTFHLTFPLNVTAFVGMGIGLLVIPLFYFSMMNDTNRNMAYKADEVAGTGGFMSKKELKEYTEKYIVPDSSDLSKPSENMIMSNSFRRPNDARKLIGNNNVLVVGGAGTGKSRFFIKPNILQMNCSFVTTDPSGEVIYSVGSALVNHGYKIKIFNISDMGHSNCYNPLQYIRDEAGVNMVIDCLINNTTAGKDEQDFWVKAEKLLYGACIFYLKDFCNDESKKNFPSVLNMINASAIDENDTNAKSPLDKMFDVLPKDSLAWKYYKAFKQAAGKTLKSIVISCVTRLQPFMTPQVVNLTKTDTLELDKIGDEKTALFIITPQADRTYSFLASMLYSQLFETLYFKGEQQKAAGGSERLNVPVRCLMDEFANIGTVPEFPSKLSTMRKYNISATVVLQDISQIEAMYKDEWKTLVGNSSSIVFLGSSEPNTLKYFSDMLGKKTITNKSRGVNKSGKGGGSSNNFQQTGREVMTPDELGRLDSSEQIVFTMNMRPVLDKKFKYEQHRNYKETADYDESQAFLYNKMAEYDNSKPLAINSLLKASAEAARIRAQELVTDPQPADDFHLPGDMIEVYDKLFIEKKKEEEAKMEALDKSITLAMGCMTDPVAVYKMDGIPNRLLPEILKNTAMSLRKSPMIMFTDLGCGKLAGVGIALNGENLFEAMNNKYALDTKDKGDGMVLTAISSKAYERYKDFVNDAFAGNV